MRLSRTRSSSASAPGPVTSGLAERGHIDDPREARERPRARARRARTTAAWPTRTGAGRRRCDASDSRGSKWSARSHRSCSRTPPPPSFLLAALQRTRAQPARELITIKRKPQPVVVAVRLTGGRRREPRVVIGVTKAPRAIGVQVQLRLAVDDPLGERAADPARAAETVQRQAGGDPEAGRARDRAEQRVGVGRHRVRMAQQADHARPIEEWEAPDRAFQKWREAVHVGLHRACAVIPRDAVGPPDDRVGLIAARSASRRPRSCRRRGCRGPGSMGCRAGSRGRAPPASARAGDRLAPTTSRTPAICATCGAHTLAASTTHSVSIVPPVCAYRADPSAAPELDPRDHPSARCDLDAQPARGVGDGVGRDVRVHVSVTRDPDAAVECVRGGVREVFEHFARADQPSLEPERDRAAPGSLQVGPGLGAGRDPDAADGVKGAQLAIQRDAVAPGTSTSSMADGLNWVTSPAAWCVELLVSSPLSSSTTSREPASARW